MKKIGFLVIVYGVLIVLGGLMGYILSHSLPSLIMGCLFGLVTVASGFGLNRNVRFTLPLSIAITILLALFFTYRFFISYKFLPAGLMVILSLLVLLSLLASCCKFKK